MHVLLKSWTFEDELFLAFLRAIYLEKICGNFLDLESPSKRWKVRETSVSDLIIAHFQNTSFTEVHVDASDELRTSADLETAFCGTYNFITYLQAKRSTQNKNSYSFKEINHKVGEHYQVKLLQEYCKTETAKHRTPHIPLYLFYHGNQTSRILECSNLTVGWIDQALEYASNGKRWSLLCQDHQKESFPFSNLFWPSGDFLKFRRVIGMSKIRPSSGRPSKNTKPTTTQKQDPDISEEFQEIQKIDKTKLNYFEMATSNEAKKIMESYRERFHERNIDRHIDVGEETLRILPYRRMLIHS